MSATLPPLIPVVLAGGAGTRLWPLSRAQTPKPWLSLSGRGATLIEETLERALAVRTADSAVVVAAQAHGAKVADLCRRYSGLCGLLEPQGRNTAPALTAAALMLQRRHGADACLLMMPADHWIESQDGFANSIAEAHRLAAAGEVVALGFAPQHPHTGYGYIGRQGGAAAGRFVEKPDGQRAQELVQSGDYLWNSGIFCFQLGRLADLLQEHCPEIVQQVRDALPADAAESDRAGVLSLGEPFASAQSISIDRALMERLPSVVAVEGSGGWSDLGTWDSVARLERRSPQQGERVIRRGSERTHVESASDRLVALLDADDLVVVDTPDALLIAKKERSGEIGDLYAEISGKYPKLTEVSAREQRPWGEFILLGQGENYKIKRIRVRPGQALSLQHHEHRSEHWTLVSGSALVSLDGEEHRLETGQSIVIPAGSRHRLSNPSADAMLEVIEVQTGSYLGEDDIVRHEDMYDRPSG